MKTITIIVVLFVALNLAMVARDLWRHYRAEWRRARVQKEAQEFWEAMKND